MSTTVKMPQKVNADKLAYIAALNRARKQTLYQEPPGRCLGKVLLTVELAEFLMGMLSKNERDIAQRSLRIGPLSQYIRSQKEGKWKFNGDSICLSKHLFPMQGQHRCEMVIKTKTPIWVILVDELPEDVMPTYDAGANRTTTDVLTQEGFSRSHANTIAGASRMELFFRAYAFPIQKSSKYNASSVDVLELLENTPDLIDANEYIWGHWSRSVPKLHKSGCVWLLYRMRLHDHGFADEFMHGLISGAGLMENDTRLWVRAKLIREASMVKTIATAYRLAYIAKSWDRQFRGKSLRTPKNFFSQVSPSDEFAHLALHGEEFFLSRDGVPRRTVCTKTVDGQVRMLKLEPEEA